MDVLGKRHAFDARVGAAERPFSSRPVPVGVLKKRNVPRKSP
jgi:hypothetical protein